MNKLWSAYKYIQITVSFQLLQTTCTYIHTQMNAGMKSYDVLHTYMAYIYINIFQVIKFILIFFVY